MMAESIMFALCISGLMNYDILIFAINVRNICQFPYFTQKIIDSTDVIPV